MSSSASLLLTEALTQSLYTTVENIFSLLAASLLLKSSVTRTVPKRQPSRAKSAVVCRVSCFFPMFPYTR